MALLETVGLAGHAATALVAVNLAVNTAHLAAAAGWIGGVVVLLAAAFPATRTLTEAERARALGPMMEASLPLWRRYPGDPSSRRTSSPR